MKTYITETRDGKYSDVRIKAKSWEEAESILNIMNRQNVVIIGELIDEI
jgi:hypothetical protein